MHAHTQTHRHTDRIRRGVNTGTQTHKHTDTQTHRHTDTQREHSICSRKHTADIESGEQGRVCMRTMLRRSAPGLSTAARHWQGAREGGRQPTPRRPLPPTCPQLNAAVTRCRTPATAEHCNKGTPEATTTPRSRAEKCGEVGSDAGGRLVYSVRYTVYVSVNVCPAVPARRSNTGVGII